jgi:hypothetical protein
MLGARQLLPLLAVALFATSVLAADAPAGATDIGKLADCSAAGDVLPAGLTQCKDTGSTLYNNTKYYTFKTDGKGTHGLLALLSTVQGDATLQFWGPDASDVSKEPEKKSIYVYTTVRTSESYLYLAPGQLTKAGNYTLGVRTTVSAPSYLLNVYTPVAGQMLVQSEADALSEIHKLCCAGRTPSSTITPTWQGRDICKEGCVAGPASAPAASCSLAAAAATAAAAAAGSAPDLQACSAWAPGAWTPGRRASRPRPPPHTHGCAGQAAGALPRGLGRECSSSRPPPPPLICQSPLLAPMAAARPARLNPAGSCWRRQSRTACPPVTSVAPRPSPATPRASCCASTRRRAAWCAPACPTPSRP